MVADLSKNLLENSGEAVGEETPGSSYDMNTSLVQSSSQTPTVDVPWRRYVFFCILVYLQLMCNFDSGVLASVVGTGVFKISPTWEGWVASSVYLGHIVGCLAAGPVLNNKRTRSNIKHVISICMCLNALCAWSFAFASIVWIMILTRFVSGVASAFIVVYCPLWVDDYAPANRATIWMSVLQAGVPLGIVVGYMVTGLVRSYSSLTWQWAFYLQSFMLVPGALVTLVSSPTVVNLKGTHASKPREESPGKTNGSDVPNSAPIIKISHFKQISSLFRNPLWLSSVFCLCSLYFVVTGLQLWSTAYLTAPEPIHAPMPTVVLSFGITCITAPVIGVLIGGVLMDISGGYSGNMTGATMIGAVCGYVAVLSASAALYMTNLWGFMGFVWIVLCTGGAVVPIMTGLSISCVPKEMRNLACSVAAVLYNLLGYFLGPLICGVVTTGQVQVEGAQPEDADVRLGMTIVLEASSISWICMLAACVIVRRQSKELNIIESESAAPSSGITEVDVSRSACSSFALPFHNHEYSDIEDSQDEGPEPNEEESHQVSFSNHSFHGTNSETEPLSH